MYKFTANGCSDVQAAWTVGKLLDFPSNGTISGASVDILPRAVDTALHVEFGASGDLGC